MYREDGIEAHMPNEFFTERGDTKVAFVPIDENTEHFVNMLGNKSKPVFIVSEYDYFYNDFEDELGRYTDYEQALERAKMEAMGWCEDGTEIEIEEHGNLTFVKTGCDFGTVILMKTH